MLKAAGEASLLESLSLQSMQTSASRQEASFSSSSSGSISESKFASMSSVKEASFMEMHSSSMMESSSIRHMESSSSRMLSAGFRGKHTAWIVCCPLLGCKKEKWTINDLSFLNVTAEWLQLFSPLLYFG